MAHELLSVKLCELDEKLGRLHSRIQFSQKAEVQQGRDGWENIRNL